MPPPLTPLSRCLAFAFVFSIGFVIVSFSSRQFLRYFWWYDYHFITEFSFFSITFRAATVFSRWLRVRYAIALYLWDILCLFSSLIFSFIWWAFSISSRKYDSSLPSSRYFYFQPLPPLYFRHAFFAMSFSLSLSLLLSPIIFLFLRFSAMQAEASEPLSASPLSSFSIFIFASFRFLFISSSYFLHGWQLSSDAAIDIFISTLMIFHWQISADYYRASFSLL